MKIFKKSVTEYCFQFTTVYGGFQNGPELLPRVNMLLLLTRVIATATPRLQVS